MNRDIFKFFGIRKKLIMYFLLTIALLSVTSVYSFYNAKTVLKNTNYLITDYVYLNNLKETVNEMMTALEKYLTTPSSDSLTSYYNCSNHLNEITRQIPKTLDYDYEKLVLKDIGYMLDELMSESDKAIQAKRGRISSKYIAHFNRTQEISDYIKLYDTKLLDIKLKSGSEKAESINKKMEFMSYFNVLIIIATILVNLFIAIISTYRLTKPLAQLSHSAEKISVGDFDIELTQTHTGDETDILASAFIKMAKSIRNYIDELKEHAEVEKRLKEQELNNLKMKSLLKEAELKFLQSQINPHFLFNTLNAASQLAMIEGADKSSEFMENIAQLFRYNLKNIEELVTLREEIEYVKNYMQVLKIRFGSRITFYSNIDESTLDVKIPRITIQPIVENAYIHGLQDLERNGEIHMNVKNSGDSVHIEIIDNGKGMDSACIQGILGSEQEEVTFQKHVNGIGINNVIQRLQYLFNIADKQKLVNIESEIGQGTKVTLILPQIVNPQ
ncbi:sensor histidine kinase [Clostridium thermarum]|uniref:sensor histidine kinase n=1 Tax=Clostridium thermarum TaxID=1716543 RepID=UPI001122FD11|nr:histidine kinase [Clostridium thermarum]